MSKKIGLFFAALLVISLILTACAPQEVVVTKEVVKTVEVEKEVVKTVEVEKEVEKEVVKTVEVEKEVEVEVMGDATLAIEHFSIIEGTTWSGAHDRAGKRIAEKYPSVEYVYREEVGPDLTVPYAEELISEGADIVVGNAEFMGMPLIDIADQYPEVYFG